jgi:hypothetical protein
MKVRPSEGCSKRFKNYKEANDKRFGKDAVEKATRANEKKADAKKKDFEKAIKEYVNRTDEMAATKAKA